MADETRLNSLDRFRKVSERLILEEHGHCEIPAGCGGVVLRWQNPRITRMYMVHAYAPGTATFRIDGVEWSGRMLDLAVGPHAVTVHVTQMGISSGLAMFAGVPQFSGPTRVKPDAVNDIIRSKGDGTWKATVLEPEGENWRTPGFDDSAWVPLVTLPTSKQKLGDKNWSYELEQCLENKAELLGMASLPRPAEPKKGLAARLGLVRTPGASKPATGQVWIRHEFTIPEGAP